MKNKSWKYFLIFWFSSLQLSASNEKPLPGYRDDILVFKAHKCPENESEWRASSKRLNCSIDNDPPVNQYYCLPSARREMLVEFCYDKQSHMTEPGFCWELAGQGYLNYVNCTEFNAGCPNNSYFSEKIYMHQACLRIDPNQKCFLAEEGCMLTSTFSTITEESATESNDSSETTIAIILGMVFVPSLLGIIAWLYCFFKRRRQKSTSQQNSCLVPKCSSASSNSLYPATYKNLTLGGIETTMEIPETCECINLLQSDKNNENTVHDLEVNGDTFPNERLNEDDLPPSDLGHSRITLNDGITSSKATFGESIRLNGSVKTTRQIQSFEWQKLSSSGNNKFEPVLINNSKYLNSSIIPSNLCLVINSVNYADASTYRFLCRFDDGQIVSNAVEVLVHGDKPKPKLKCEKIGADTDTEIAIYADVNSIPSTMFVRWQYCKEKFGEFKDINMDKRYKFSEDEKQAEFAICSTKLTDSGYYRLRAVNAVGEGISDTVRLKVGEKKSFITLNERISPFEAVFGDSICLQGSVKTKHQIVSLEWQKAFSGSSKFETFSIDDPKFLNSSISPLNICLLFNFTTRSDALSYRIMCRFYGGYITSNAVEILVHGEKPNPRLKKNKLVASAETELTIYGNVNSIPSAFKLTWQYSKEKFGSFQDLDTTGKRYKFSKDEKHTELVINPTKLTDSGYYRLSAVNHLGHGISNTVLLKVFENTSSPSNFLSMCSFLPSRGTQTDNEDNVLAYQILLPNVLKIATIDVPSMRMVAHISVTANETLWISDDLDHFYHINMQGTVLYQVPVEGMGTITGHVVTKMGDLLFANKKDKMICKVSNNTFPPYKFIVTGNWKPTCIYLSQIDESILVGQTRENEAKISRYDINGDKRGEMQKSNGKDLFQLPHEIVESKEGDVYVVDTKARALLGMNKEGHHTFTYTGQNPNSFYPSGVCIDKYDHILVSNYRSNDICILDKNGLFLKFLGFIMDKSSLNSPCALCSDGKERLFIGLSEQKSEHTKIKVYKYGSDNASAS